MRERVLGLSVSHSITQQKADSEDGSLQKIETSIKMLHWTFLSSFNVLEFLVSH